MHRLIAMKLCAKLHYIDSLLQTCEVLSKLVLKRESYLLIASPCILIPYSFARICTKVP